MTVLLVTHSTAQAKNICKRGLVLKDGGLIFDGKIEEAIEAYEKTLTKKKKKKSILSEKVKQEKVKEETSPTESAAPCVEPTPTVNE